MRDCTKKDQYFRCIECNDIKEFVTEIQKKSDGDWIYRGQKDSDWHLVSSLERACSRFFVQRNEWNMVENHMIREFQRRIHHYTSSIPDHDSIDEWLALMQHHGAPTRFLDFSYSPYVAAYFAFEFVEGEKTVAIWAVDIKWLKETLKTKNGKLYLMYDKYIHERENDKTLFKKMKETFNDKLVLRINPFRLNERLAYQQGIFLCPMNISQSFEDNLLAHSDIDQTRMHVEKYIINTGNRNQTTIESLEYLGLMNVNRITLFPGLDGFTQSFEARIRSLFAKKLY